jgi:carbon monoxide dehydrogenase subunit G
MHLSGETDIAATRARVWDAVSNPSAAVAGDERGQATVEKIDDRHYRVTVTPAGAPVPMNVTLDLELTELTAPSRVAATIAGVVMGGPVNGTGHIDLAELGPKLTRATWEADATLGGLLGGFEPMLAGPLQGGAEQGLASLKARLEAEEAAAG